tara:strand:+ start:1078 stop:1218 length:141 start_codon:yes stop_codon:yes gene_type:complete
MKRRSFIKGTALGGVGISSFSNVQRASKKINISINNICLKDNLLIR